MMPRRIYQEELSSLHLVVLRKYEELAARLLLFCKMTSRGRMLINSRHRNFRPPHSNVDQILRRRQNSTDDIRPAYSYKSDKVSGLSFFHSEMYIADRTRSTKHARQAPL
jgi:hypothetical protein